MISSPSEALPQYLSPVTLGHALGVPGTDHTEDPLPQAEEVVGAVEVPLDTGEGVMIRTGEDLARGSVSREPDQTIEEGRGVGRGIDVPLHLDDIRTGDPDHQDEISEMRGMAVRVIYQSNLTRLTDRREESLPIGDHLTGPGLAPLPCTGVGNCRTLIGRGK
uniref:Uncharacterized protein n=1 Tax=Cacopsylla melanoneura TaxID=428564 RepID=A0A8D8TZH4_9HEMI